MVVMISALLSLALLRVAVPIGFSTEFAPAGPSPYQARIVGAKGSAKTRSARPAAEQAEGEGDCIDDDDDSDESSSCKHRADGYRGSLSRYALAFFRTKLQRGVEAPRDVLVPLFYVFCRLLL